MEAIEVAKAIRATMKRLDKAGDGLLERDEARSVRLRVLDHLQALESVEIPEQNDRQKAVRALLAVARTLSSGPHGVAPDRLAAVRKRLARTAALLEDA